MPPGYVNHPRVSESSEGNEPAIRPTLHRVVVDSDMATAIQTCSQPSFSIPQYSPRDRPTLPPLFASEGPSLAWNRIPTSSPLVSGNARHYSIPSIATSVSHGYNSASARSSISSTQESVLAQRSPDLLQPRPSSRSAFPRLPPLDMSIQTLKRPFGALSHTLDQKSYQQSAPAASPGYADTGIYPIRLAQSIGPSPIKTFLPGATSFFPSQPPARYSEPPKHEGHKSTPSHTVPQPTLQPSSNAHRCSLHIRQQPRAARAGPDGKDRRSIDPPPVLQLMLTDFDPYSNKDMSEIRSSCFVVHCRLISPYLPRTDVSTFSCVSDDGSTEIQRLLLGTTVSSPFFCRDDPDPSNMPEHPKSQQQSTKTEAPPLSPTARFLHPRTAPPVREKSQLSDDQQPTPGAFFIFPDLSVRKAGEYRLEFALMKIEPAMMIAGARLPIISTVTTPVFRVVNAKDFDQVQPSTDLVKGLLDRGAGFPLKLKKGTRESSSHTKQRDDDSLSDNEDDAGGGGIEASDGED